MEQITAEARLQEALLVVLPPSGIRAAIVLEIKELIQGVVDQTAENLLKQARAEEPELSGQFVEGVEALKAAVAAALGVGTK
ncbi:hypothetical protein [Microcystis phage Mwe-JY26]